MYSRGRQDETANALRDSADEEARSDAMAYALCFEFYFNAGGRGEELPIKSSVDTGVSGLLLGAEARWRRPKTRWVEYALALLRYGDTVLYNVGIVRGTVDVPGILFASGVSNNIIGVDICRTVVLLLLNDLFIPAEVGYAPRPIGPH